MDTKDMQAAGGEMAVAHRTASWRGWLAVAVLAVAVGCWLRGTDLERSATRSDEINQLRYAERGPAAVVELWKNPPWLNHLMQVGITLYVQPITSKSAAYSLSSSV